MKSKQLLLHIHIIAILIFHHCSALHAAHCTANVTDSLLQPRHVLRQIDDLPTNFHFHGFSDPVNLNAAKQGVIDMLSLTNAALAAADSSSSSFSRYFQHEDMNSVLAIFDKIIAESAPVENTDTPIIDIYFHTWSQLPDRTAKCDDHANLLAVTVEGIVTPEDKNIILCAELFKRTNRALADIPCHSLGVSATWASMDTIGSTILHEMLHLGTLLDAGIDDVQVDVEGVGSIPGYGPYGAMMVNRVDQLGILNADSYVWFAMEAWFMDECNLNGFEDPLVEIIRLEL